MREGNNLRINGRRLRDRLAALAAIGATPAGGCNRQALTAEDGRARDVFVAWCRAANLRVHVDAIGNIFGVRTGRDPTAAVVLAGSHLDTQPTGGRFDGVYGVLAALEALESLNDAGIETERPLVVANWTNEEGARFAPAMMGSGVFGGEFPLAAMRAVVDRDGTPVAAALAAIGYDGSMPMGSLPVHSSFEVHIEQGPVLEAAATTIGVVTGVQGICWYDVTLTGQESHAGPTPMAMRRDPVLALAELALATRALADANAPWGRATLACIRSQPDSRNTVPGSVRLTIDMRNPDADALTAMDAALRNQLAAIAARHRIDAAIDCVWRSPVVRFDARCVDAVRTAAAALGERHMDIVSGAGHDSVYVARVAPAAMIFVPCRGGLSHNEAEDADAAHLESGANVLLHAMLSAAS